jgi:spore coat protein SA
MHRKPVIAIVTPGTFAMPSATSSSVELVVEQVTKCASAEAEIVIFGKKTGKHPAFELLDGVRHIRVPRVSPLDYIKRISKEIAKLKPDLIQVENRPRFAAYLRRRHPSTPVWLSLHSLTFVSKPYIEPAAARRCLMAPHRILVNSEYLKERVAQIVPGAKRRIAVNHLGVDGSRFDSRWEAEASRLRKDMLESLGLGNRKVILFVGRWIKQKGVHHLIEAMPSIIKKVPDVVLLLVGGAAYGSNKATPYVRRMRRLAAKLPEHVRLIPFVPHDEISEWFRLADLMVMPSVEKEAFGLVNLEAMASSVPVIGTRVGGIKEIIEHGVTGYLIDPGHIRNELPGLAVNLLSDEELRRCMGELGRQRVGKHFTWEITSARWLDRIRSSI